MEKKVPELDDSDIEVVEVHANISRSSQKKRCKGTLKNRKKTKVHVNSVDCSKGNQQKSYIKEEVMISDCSHSSDNESDDEVKIERVIHNPNSIRRPKPRRKNESRSLITLHCPRCNKIQKVFSTTIKSTCKECKINMEYVCDKCDLRYQTLLALFRHKKLQCQLAMTPGKLIIRKCWKCSHTEPLACMRDVKNCPQCNISLLYECTVCSKSWSTYAPLGGHSKSQCQLSKVYYCNECDFKTPNHLFMKSHLENHYNTTQGKPTVLCGCCGKQFANPSNLRRHELICGKPYYYCKFCPFKPRFQMSLRRHLMKDHSDIVRPENIDDIIRDIAANEKTKNIEKNTLGISPSDFSLKHLKSSYCLKCEEPKPYRNKIHQCRDCGCQLVYECMYCDRKVKNTQLLYRHVHRKHGDVKFRCQHCNRGFKFFGDVNDHQKNCTSIQKVKCTVCVFETRYKYNLKLHMNTFHNLFKIVFKCPGCGLQFKSKITLDKHILFHCKNDNPTHVENEDSILNEVSTM